MFADVPTVLEQQHCGAPDVERGPAAAAKIGTRAAPTRMTQCAGSQRRLSSSTMATQIVLVLRAADTAPSSNLQNFGGECPVALGLRPHASQEALGASFLAACDAMPTMFRVRISQIWRPFMFCLVATMSAPNVPAAPGAVASVKEGVESNTWIPHSPSDPYATWRTRDARSNGAVRPGVAGKCGTKGLTAFPPRGFHGADDHARHPSVLPVSETAALPPLETRYE